MRKPVWLLAGLLLVVGAVAVWLRPEVPRPRTPELAQPQSPPRSLQTPAPKSTPPASAAVAVPTSTATATEEPKPLFVAGLEATLQADADGKLLMTAETLRALEMLLGMSAREREQRRARLVQQLPPVAASQALDLMERVSDYRDAVVRAFPAGSPPTTVEQARSMLEALHRLRVEHLGEDAASAFFAQEERAARGFIESAARASNAQRTVEEQASATARLLSSLFGMFILPRKPPRAIGQEDP